MTDSLARLHEAATPAPECCCPGCPIQGARGCHYPRPDLVERSVYEAERTKHAALVAAAERLAGDGLTVVPTFWWHSPPNRATADVVDALKLLATALAAIKEGTQHE